MNNKNNSIFRDELPGEKKSIINLLMTGHIVTISCLGYMAFFLFIQLGQVTRIVNTIDANSMSTEQINLLKERVTRSVGQWQNEMIGLAIFGSIVSIIGGIYTINMVIRPLNKLIKFADKEGKAEPLPDFKSNTEIKQLATAITGLTKKLEEATPRTKKII
jgi:methyl-accepting chemotaxis protein